MDSSAVEPRIKIISLGSSGVGKSCFIKRYCEGRFITKYIPTIGIDYGVKRVRVRQPGASANPTLWVRVNFWDMAGGAEYVEVRNEFYASVEGVALLYDVTDAATFRALEVWVKEMETHRLARVGVGADSVSAATSTRPAARGSLSTKGQSPIVVVCANKVDDEHDGRRRAVSEAEGRQWAEGKGYKYFETSACTGKQVTEALETLFNDVVAAFM